jgi:predicted transcriptional regulator of viral defense system
MMRRGLQPTAAGDRGLSMTAPTYDVCIDHCDYRKDVCTLFSVDGLRTGDLVDPLQLTRDQERELFRRLARGGLIARVRPGLYLVPSRLPLGGSWSPDEILALTTLMEDRNGQYQICGPNAFNRYGFDEQVPTRVYAYNNRISGERSIGSVQLTLIKVAGQRLGDTENIETPEGLVAVYSSRARTLIDAVYDWSRFNSLPRAYGWIGRELAEERVKVASIVDTTLRYGDKGTIRRIGALLESESVDPKLLRRLEKALSPSTGLIPWIPGRPKRGTINRRWGVVLNEEP